MKATITEKADGYLLEVTYKEETKTKYLEYIQILKLMGWKE